MNLPLAVDVAEAAELTGLSHKALRRWIERGSLPAVLHYGRRRIPVSELRRARLLEGQERALSGRGGNGGSPEGQPEALGAAELLREISRLSEQLGHARAIAERAESLGRQADAEREARERAEAEVHRLRAELEAARRPRRWWRRWMRIPEPAMH